MTHRDWLVRVHDGIMWVDGERCSSLKTGIAAGIVAAIVDELGAYPMDTTGIYAEDSFGSYFVVSRKDVTP